MKRTRIRRLSLTASVAVCGVLVGLAVPAVVDAMVSPSLKTPNVVVSTKPVLPGANLKISASGFEAAETISFGLDGNPTFFGQATTSSAGKAAINPVLPGPANLPSGKHLVTASTLHQGATAALTVGSGDDWSQFRNGASQTGVTVNPWIDPANASNLTTKFATQLGARSQTNIAIAGGVAYIGDKNGVVTAVDAVSGAIKWSNTTSGCPESTGVAVAGSVVYVVCRDASSIVAGPNNGLAAFDVFSGTHLWTFPAFYPAQGAPVVANGIVYLTALDAVTPTGVLWAVNAVTGTQVWGYGGINPVGTPAVAGGIVSVATVDGVISFNAANAALLWAFATGAPTYGSPAVDKGAVFVGTQDGKVFSLKATDGSLNWTSTVGGSLSPPAVANGIVYIGSDDNDVYALSATTGATVWSTTTFSAVSGAPAVANGVVYVANYSTSAGFAYALDATTGAALWARPNTDRGSFMGMSIADGALYMADGAQLVKVGL